VDINYIFGLFSDEEQKQNESSSTSLIDFKETPLFCVGLFKKIITNNTNFHVQILGFLKDNLSEDYFLNYGQVGELVIFLRSWFYINKINLKKELDQEAVKFYAGQDLEVCLKLAISFFEEREEYEKCAHIKNILDFIQEI
jgi:hypothetical protein